MDAIRRFASQRAMAFGVMMTFVLVALYIVAGIAAAVFSTVATGQQTVEAVGRLAGSVLIIWMLWRVGWVSDAGIVRLGAWSAWLLVLPFLAYQIVVHMFAFFADTDFGLPDPAMAGAVALNASAAGLLEELVFRGVILCALLKAWANSTGGLARSVLLSSFLFGAAHLIRIGLGQPVAVVSLLALDGLLAGIYYAAFVLYARSVWPAVAIHALLNAVVGARAVGTAGFEETVAAWLVILVLKLPAVAFGLYLLRRVRSNTVAASGG